MPVFPEKNIYTMLLSGNVSIVNKNLFFRIFVVLFCTKKCYNAVVETFTLLICKDIRILQGKNKLSGNKFHAKTQRRKEKTPFASLREIIYLSQLNK
jgi:hypothetical protein